MKADDLYNALAANAWKLAAQSMLDVDDIKQELYLKCMEVAEGRSTYSPLVGGVHEYIMGWMWKFILRWTHLQSLDEWIEEDIVGQDWATQYLPVTHSRLLALHVPSTEEVLIRRSEMYEQHTIDCEDRQKMQEINKNKTTFCLLMQTKQWSIREAAQYFGVSKYQIEKSCGI
jgi:hypothetical protein